MGGFKVQVCGFNHRMGEPALNQVRVVSKGSRKVFATPEECMAVLACRSPSKLFKANRLGSITILNTPYGVVELKDAVKKQVGGEVLLQAH
jgi:small subunit ribosomal protein S8